MLFSFSRQLTLWSRSSHPIFRTKETSSGRSSLQCDPAGEWQRMGRHQVKVIPQSIIHATAACCPLTCSLLPPCQFSSVQFTPSPEPVMLHLERVPTMILLSAWYRPHLEHFLHGWLYLAVHAQSLSHVPLFVTPTDCSAPGPFVHGIFQARLLQWVAISYPIVWHSY